MRRSYRKAPRQGVLPSFLAALLMLIALIAGGWLLYPQAWRFLSQQQAFRIREVSFQNVSHIEESDLRALLPAVEGVNLFAVNLEEIKTAVGKHPWVNEAELYRRFPSKLVISITERNPVALLNGNRVWAVDREGTLLSPDEWNGSLDLPLINVSLSPEQKAGDTVVQKPLRKVLIGLEALRRRLPEMWLMISEVSWDSSGQVSLYASSSHTNILLGSDPQWQQLVRFYSFLIYEGGTAGLEDIVLVDLRFRENVIVRRIDRTADGSKHS